MSDDSKDLRMLDFGSQQIVAMAIKEARDLADEYRRQLEMAAPAALVAKVIQESVGQDIRRIADHFDPPPPDIVDTRYVADKLGCTPDWIAKLAAKREIPASCTVSGTGVGKPWKFYRSRIDRWMDTRDRR